MAATETQCARLLQALRRRSACSGLDQTMEADDMLGNHLSVTLTRFPPAAASVAKCTREGAICTLPTHVDDHLPCRPAEGWNSLERLESSREMGSGSISQSTRAKCTCRVEAREHVCGWRTAGGVGVRSFRRKRPSTGHPQPGPTQAGSAP